MLKRETINVSFRLELGAHARLIEKADMAGISIRAWLEDAILQNATKIIQRAKPHPEITSLLFQVSRAGNNINQIAHQLNSLALSGKMQPLDLAAALDRLEGIQEQLHEALEHAR